MLGLFDPPDKGIFKRIPPEAQMECIAVMSYVDVNLPTPATRRPYLAAVVGSIWARRSHDAGKFILKPFDYDWIRSMGINCVNKLSETERDAVTSLIKELIDKGVIPYDDEI